MAEKPKSSKNPRKGFTLIELMIVVAIVGILAAIAIPKFADTLRRAREGATLGGLGSLRSALSVYIASNEGGYIAGGSSLSSLMPKYIGSLPMLQIPPYHSSNQNVSNTNGVVGVFTLPQLIKGCATAAESSDSAWCYSNLSPIAATMWAMEGVINVGCVHTDSKGTLWTLY